MRPKDLKQKNAKIWSELGRRFGRICCYLRTGHSWLRKFTGLLANKSPP